MKLLEGRTYVSLSLNLWCLTCSRNKSLDISGKNPSRGKEGHTRDMVKHHRARPNLGNSVFQMWYPTPSLWLDESPKSTTIWQAPACWTQLLELGWFVSFPWILFLALVYPMALTHPSSVWGPSPPIQSQPHKQCCAITLQCHVLEQVLLSWHLRGLRLEQDCGSESISHVTG